MLVVAFRSISAPNAVLPNAGAVAPVPIAIHPIAAPVGLEDKRSAMWASPASTTRFVGFPVRPEFPVGAVQLDPDVAVYRDGVGVVSAASGAHLHPIVDARSVSFMLRRGGEHRERAVVDDDGLERADDADLDTADGGLHDTELDRCPCRLGDEQAGAVTDDDDAGVHAAGDRQRRAGRPRPATPTRTG